MGQVLAQTYPEAAETFRQTDEILGYSLSNVCWHEPESVLNETVHTQPALLTHSIAVLRVLEAHRPSFQASKVAGHSLGEISALVAAGSLDFESALRLVQVRGESMRHAGEVHPGGMSAVLGLSLEAVEEACQAASDDVAGGVWIANDNCPGQVVISGDEDALDAVTPLLQEAGARRVLRLAVSIAAHSPLMEPAQDRFNAAVQDTTFQEPTIEIIGNVHAAALTDASEISADLQAQLTSRVRWTETIMRMGEAGIQTFYEIGSGSVLCGLLKRILPEAHGISLDSPENLKEIL
jgi:[acyl-carrier-protein] S-malonyltransferase